MQSDNIWAENIIKTSNKIIEKQDSFSDDEIEMAKHNLTTVHKMKRDITKTIEKVKMNLKDLEHIYTHEHNTLLVFAKQYYFLKQRDAKDVLDEKPILKFEPVSEENIKN